MKINFFFDALIGILLDLYSSYIYHNISPSVESQSNLVNK